MEFRESNYIEVLKQVDYDLRGIMYVWTSGRYYYYNVRS